MIRHKFCDQLEGNYDIDPITKCWNWKWGKGNTGYGRLYVDGKRVMAHRHYYEIFVGPIPKGLVIHHKCHNKACVNPEHLEVKTRKENVLEADGIMARNARKTHCPSGHAYTTKNTYINRDGKRYCRKCHVLKMRNYRKLNPEHYREYQQQWKKRLREKVTPNG